MAENKKPGVGFEESDVNVIAVGKFGVSMVLATIVAMGLVVGVFNFFRAQEGGKAAYVDPTKTFPQPQLETTPIPELKAVREGEKQVLDNYGWVDQQKGVVRIPIDQAMNMVVQKGMAVRTPVPPSAEGVTVPTASGLGPKMLPPGGPLGDGK
jgi:hypothetical protein